MKRLQGIRLLQKCVSRTVDELECLHDEFNFADPTTAEFHIPAEPALSDNIAFDPSFNMGNLIQQIGRRTLGVNARLKLPHEFVS